MLWDNHLVYVCAGRKQKKRCMETKQKRKSKLVVIFELQRAPLKIKFNHTYSHTCVGIMYNPYRRSNTHLTLIRFCVDTKQETTETKNTRSFSFARTNAKMGKRHACNTHFFSLETQLLNFMFSPEFRLFLFCIHAESDWCTASCLRFRCITSLKSMHHHYRQSKLERIYVYRKSVHIWFSFDHNYPEFAAAVHTTRSVDVRIA